MAEWMTLPTSNSILNMNGFSKTKISWPERWIYSDELRGSRVIFWAYAIIYPVSPSGLVVENPPDNAGDVSLIPVSGRSPGEGNGNILLYSCLGNPMDRRTRVRSQKSRTYLVTRQKQIIYLAYLIKLSELIYLSWEVKGKRNGKGCHISTTLKGSWLGVKYLLSFSLAVWFWPVY